MRQTKAVFLSYASEDTEAARRICAGLRAAGIEVWFDQSELRGGEVWDRQIRKEIHDCALFVPVISANTQARLEGYFRREWNLAADRTHDMAAEKAFLVPVSIDETSERRASVPDKFRDVQWMRLPAGAASPAFIERILRLLQMDSPPAATESLATGTAAPASAAGAGVGIARLRRIRVRTIRFVRDNRAWFLAASAAVAITLAAIAALLIGALRRAPDLVWRDPLAEAKVTPLTDFDGTQQAATISSDGRQVAFLSDHDGHPDVWVTEIGSGQYRNLTAGQFRQLSNPEIRSVAFSPDGALVAFWTRSGEGTRAADITLMAAPIAGGPLQTYLPEAVEFAWSPDAKQVVFHTSAPGDPMFVRAAGDARAREIYVAPPGVHCHFQTWSPDGQFIYFVRGEPPAATWDVWRIRPSGANAERLTFHNARVTYPVVLDPRTLIYLATDADGSGPWLYVMNVPLRREHRISVGLERYTSLAASANGRRIVATVANSRSELWRVNIVRNGAPQTTAEPVASAAGGAAAPRFAPDYMTFVGTGAGRKGVWKLANGRARRLWEDPNAGRIGTPAISPDGRRIAFSVGEGTGTRLYVMDSDGGGVREIAAALALRGGLAWAPDSQSLIGAVERDGEPRLARIALDGSPQRAMVSEYSLDPVWSPDGKYFVYSGPQVATTFSLRAAAPDGRPYAMPSLILTRGAGRVAFAGDTGALVILRGSMGHMNFWLVDLQTGGERQLTDLPPGFVTGDFDITPDATQIIFERLRESSSIALIEPTL
jgi:Tol biopolymer transport system component